MMLIYVEMIPISNSRLFRVFGLIWVWNYSQ